MAFGALAPLPLRLGGSATEGLTASQHARLCADLVACSRTTPFAVWNYTSGTLGLTMYNYLGMNGVGAAYAPQMTAYLGDDNAVRFSWSTQPADPYGVVHALDPSRIFVTHRGYSVWRMRYEVLVLGSDIVITGYDVSTGLTEAAWATVVVY